MQQFITRDRIYITGSFPQVLEQLRELSKEFKIVKELLDAKTRHL